MSHRPDQCPFCGFNEEDALMGLKYGYDVYECMSCHKIFGINKAGEVIFIEQREAEE